ncbi:MAG: M28 family peptidase [Gemmatimonadaceae bacterium]
MNRQALITCLVPIVLGTGGCAQAPVAAATGVIAVPRTAAGESEIRRILTTLAHDSMEGRRTGSPGAERAGRFIAAEMKAIGLEPAGDSAYFQRVPFATGGRRGIQLLDSVGALASIPASDRLIGYNVIGIIRGSDPVMRDQVVLIGAHYDHVGIGKPVDGDSIYNGADDDASGVTAVLGIARIIAGGPPPKRTMLFMTSTGEEQGILGAQYYAKHPVFPIPQMVADMEIEMIGRPDSLAGGAGKAWLTGYDRSTMGAMLKAADIPIVPDPYPQMRFFERADNIIFARLGVPAHTLSSYNLHSDYHAPSDEIDKIDFAHMTAVINAAARAARLLADGPPPVWNEGGRPVAPQR